MRLFKRDTHPLQDDELFELWPPVLKADSWPALRALLDSHPVLLTPRGPRFFGYLAAQSEQSPNRRMIARRLRQTQRLLVQCGEIGVPAAIAEAQRGRRRPGLNPDEALLGQLADLIFQPTWADTQRMLNEQPVLYGIPALETLADMVAMALDDGGEEEAEAYVLHLAVLGRCREAGVNAAFAELRRVTR